MLGGVIGVAASTAILNHYLDSRLPWVLKPAELSALWRITEAVLTFPSDFQIHALAVYAMAYRSQITLVVAFRLHPCTLGCCCHYLEKAKCQVLKGLTPCVNTGVAIRYICFIIFIEPLLFSSYIIKRSNSTTTQ
jgi:hypothetical protein